MVALVEWFRAGGPVMWPILAISVVGVAIVVDRIFAFRKFFKGGLRRETPQKTLDGLSRGFVWLSTGITAAPMLGILGTVTGIIQTFSALNTDDGASPVAATGGISEALITTAAGLIVALLLLFPYNWLLAQLARAAAELENEEEA